MLKIPELNSALSRKLFWAILGIALLLRVLYLPSMPLHHDESLHAFYSYKVEQALFHDGDYRYRYDPTYHGPVLYYLNALTYAIFGTNDFTARVVPITLGILVVVLVYDFRRYIGEMAALIAMALFALSPTFIYFSRFLRMDIYSTFFNIAMVVCIMRYIHSRKPLWIILFVASISFSFCTKENIYLTIFMFGSYACVWGVMRCLRNRTILPSFRQSLTGKKRAGAVMGAVLGGILFFWMVHQLLPIIGGSYEGMEKLFSSAAIALVAKLGAAIVGIILGFVVGGILGIYNLISSLAIFFIIWITFFTALYQQPQDINAFAKAWGYWITQHKSERVGGPWSYYIPFIYLYELLIVVPLVIMIFRPGPLGSQQTGVHKEEGEPSNVEDRAVPDVPPVHARNKFMGWIDGKVPMILFLCLIAMVFIRWNFQGGEKLGALSARWFGLFFPIFLIMMSGALFAVWQSLEGRIKPFTGFLVYWAILSFFLYSFAGEKVPWLFTHILEPLTLLSAIAIAGLIIQRRTFSVAIVGILALFTIYITANLNYRFSSPNPGESIGEAEKGRHAELMVYVQSTTDVKKMMEHIEDVGRRTGAGKKLNMVITGTANWPMSWYLRDYPVNYAPKITRGVKAPVVITDWDDYRKHSAWMSDNYDSVQYQLRGWWIPDSKRVPILEPLNNCIGLSKRNDALKNLLGLGDRGNALRTLFGPGDKEAMNELGRSLGRLISYFFTRSVYSPMGSSDVVFWVRKEVAAGLPVEQVLPAPEGPPSLAYEDEGKPGRIKPIEVWGKAGSRPGQFKEPRGVAVDKEGFVYVADTMNNRIQKFTGNGRFITSWGRAGNGPGEFEQPQGIAVDRRGNIFVTDTWNNRIQKFSSDGTPLIQWGKGISAEPGEFWGPRGIAVDDAGNVYVTDTGNKRVQKFSNSGKLLLTWGGAGEAEGELVEPVGIACLGREVWVTDTGNRRVQVFTRDGKFKRTFRVAGWEEFYTEPYICLGEKGLVAVTDSRNNCIAVYSPAGKMKRYFGSEGKSPGRFDWPLGIAYDGEKRVYVVDSKNGRVQVFPSKKVFGK